MEAFKEKALMEFDRATPVNHVYLMSYFYKKELPSPASAEYLKCMQLFKFLATKGQFTKLDLLNFQEAKQR